ncbi:MAG TPA: serine hydrolase domain-containing protein [Pyrinomonadaceae bacterium]|nr:serine hydrolase domain-containing protein [Pyrinomonadaceae bacterium]
MRSLLALALLLDLVSVALSQNVTPKVAEQIKTVAGEAFKTGNSGMSVILIEHCSVSWRGDFGFADKAHNRLVDPNTRFQFGSMSKPITAWAIMTLVERGKIDLDQPVNKYLKSWKLESKQFDPSEVTVRRVLEHNAGLSVPSVTGVDAGVRVPSLVDELSGKGPSAAPLTIIEKPGNKFVYSGGGYTLLQLLIEDVTGTSFEAYVQKTIFKPLQMKTATFAPDKNTLAKTATPYNSASGETFPLRLYSSQAAAGLYSTIEDYAKFVTAHCSANNKILKPQTLASMFRGDAKIQPYGLGYELMPTLTGNPIVSHSGSNLGWKANFILFPIEGDGVVVVTNSDSLEPRRKILGVWRNAVVAKYNRTP